MIRSKGVPALVVVFALIALAAIVILQSEASAGRDAQVRLASLKTALTELQTAPFEASPTTGGSPARARALIKSDKRRVSEALASLRSESAASTLDMIGGPLRANYAALAQIYLIGASGNSYGPAADRLSGAAAETKGRVSRVLAMASHEYEANASTADDRATAGSALTIGMLLLAFLLLYRRSSRARSRAEQLAAENEALALAAGEDARTDALTGLGNRRALVEDLAAALGDSGGERELAVALFDLDGFKQYNDTFGHPAGDALLARLGNRLTAAVTGAGAAYRMGGDEFCVVARIRAQDGDSLVLRAADALTESGEGFQIECSYGLSLLPADAASTEGALQVADRRMYADKAGRSSASRQSADVLLEVLNERSLDLREHIREVAIEASATAQVLGVPDHEVSRIGLAAELHDIGKAAIPDTILNKPGPLDESETHFIRCHTVIGERIILAAPSLAPLAGLVRSSHERFDGSGYPDGLRGEEIPTGARIIAVCDAFDAMVAGRPYSDTVPVTDAREELRRCAGTQFDPKVVDAFLTASDRGPTLAAA
jgi:diguanylate cyclase (GGDEF)-like protein